MKPEDFETLISFTKRVRSILSPCDDRPEILKVSKSEYKALYRYQKDYSAPYFGFDYSEVQVSLEKDLVGNIERIKEDSEYVSKIFDKLLDISLQRDIELWPKDFRPAIKISQTERNYLDTVGDMEGKSKIFGMDLYVDESEVDEVFVPENIARKLRCTALGSISVKKQLVGSE